MQTVSAKLKSLIAEPVIVQRRDKLPVIVRIRPFEGPTHSPEQKVQNVKLGLLFGFHGGGFCGLSCCFKGHYQVVTKPLSRF
jgi:hypothetical protein